MQKQSNGIKLGEVVEVPAEPLKIDIATIESDKSKVHVLRHGRIIFQYDGRIYEFHYESAPYLPTETMNLCQLDYTIRQALLDLMYTTLQNKILGKALEDSKMLEAKSVRGIFLDGEFHRIYPSKHQMAEDGSGRVEVVPNHKFNKLEELLKDESEVYSVT